MPGQANILLDTMSRNSELLHERWPFDWVTDLLLGTWHDGLQK